MQELTSELWSPASRWHIGDLAWERGQAVEYEGATKVWSHGDTVRAWAWVEQPGFLHLQVHPDSPELAAEALGWFHRTATGNALAVQVLETETVLVTALREAGYSVVDGPFFRVQAVDPGTIAEPVLPPGFTARPLDGPEDLEKRVAVHREAFAPSRLTVESYRAVMATWPYRADLDWLIENANGKPVSYATFWLDEARGAGLLEPAGTDPRYRRLGLARAVCAYGLRALAEAGATVAVVAPRGDEAYPVPARLYRSLGFVDGPRTLTFARSQESGRSEASSRSA